MDAPTVASGLEPGSFRDPDSRVFTTDGRVLRLLSEQGLADWRELSSSGLVDELVGEGRLVGTREVEEEAALGEAIHGGVAGVLEHDVIPFVSYPYEWTFSMLRDAALLQLELLRRALDQGLILKDSTPYNVQFRGAEPVFIDVGSFEKQREGEPWAGYRQFCMLFLYPLLLAGVEGRALPAVAAREPRRDRAAGAAQPALVPRPLPPRRRSRTSCCTRGWRAVTRTATRTSRASCARRASSAS